MYNIFYLHQATWTWLIPLGIKNNGDIIEAPGLEDQYLVAFTPGSLGEKSNSNLKWSVVLTNLLNIQPTMERHTHLSLAHKKCMVIKKQDWPLSRLSA